MLTLAAGLVLSGYVTPPQKLLERWVGSGFETRPRGPVEVPVRWGEQPGVLYAAGPGRNALRLEGRTPVFDPGPGLGGRWEGLWRAVDLFCPLSPDELAGSLERAGIDLGRGGYARSTSSSDGVAHTLGARGEGEGDLAQLWIDRVPFGPVRLQIPGAAGVRVGPLGESGWPSWFLLESVGLLEVTGPPTPSPVSPAWTLPGERAGGAGAEPSLDWLRAFDEWRR